MSVREGLMVLLADGPRNGHQLKTEFEMTTGGVWPLNVGQVYTTLDRLSRDGLVVRADGNGGEAVRAHRGRARGACRMVGARAGGRTAAARRADAEGPVRGDAGDRARARGAH